MIPELEMIQELEMSYAHLLVQPAQAQPFALVALVANIELTRRPAYVMIPITIYLEHAKHAHLLVQPAQAQPIARVAYLVHVVLLQIVAAMIDTSKTIKHAPHVNTLVYYAQIKPIVQAASLEIIEMTKIPVCVIKPSMIIIIFARNASFHAKIVFLPQLIV